MYILIQILITNTIKTIKIVLIYYALMAFMIMCFLRDPRVAGSLFHSIKVSNTSHLEAT